MLKVGLTGGIGSGKSTVSRMVGEYNIPIIDADIVSREIFQIYSNIKDEIASSFGGSFFDGNGDLKRQELGNYVFKDKRRLEILEAITLPYIIKEIFTRLKKYNDTGTEICILDAPTLIETGLHKYMDLNILVWVDQQTQFERVKRRDNIDCEHILNRIKAQMSLEDKKNYVDFIIDNSGTLEYTKEQVEDIINNIITMRY